MFGISRREIEQKIAEKVVKHLKSKGHISIPHVGTLIWTSGTDTVRFEQAEGLINELKEK